MKYIKLYENRHDFVFDEQRFFPATSLVQGEDEPTYFTDVEEVVFELTVSLPTEKVVTGETYTLAVEYGGADVFSEATVTSTGDVTLNGTQFTANTDGDFSVSATYGDKTVTLNGTSKLMTDAPTIFESSVNNQYGQHFIHISKSGATKRATFNGVEYTSAADNFSRLYYEELTAQTVVVTATAQETGKWESDTATATFNIPAAQTLTATISDDTLEDGETAQLTVMYGSTNATSQAQITASGDVTCTSAGVVTAAYSTGSGNIVVNYNNLPPITINVTVTEAAPVSPKIVFADPDVESIITEAYGSNGEITEAQAAAVTTFLSGNSLYNPFYNNTKVDSFDEFSYFTGITEIATTFRGCSKMASITIPANVTSIDNYAFERCSSLTSINIPAAVTSIGSYTFSGCSGLTDITIPSGVTSIGNYAFNGCSSIGSAFIEGEITSIGDYAFNGCSGMWAIVFLATTPPTIGTGVFNDTNEYCPIYVPKESVGAYKAAWSDYASRIIAIPPQKQKIVFADPDVKTILVNKFGSDGEITDEQAAAVTTFMSGTNTSANPFYKNANVDSFDEFAYFTGISSVGINTFNGCSNMTSITIPENVTSIGERAFDYCYLLGSITIPDSVTYIGRSAFQACTGLTTLNLGSYVETIDLYAFKECSSLTSVNIPDSVTTLGDQAFNSCTNLNTVTIGQSVSAIPNDTFPRTISYVTVSSQNNTYDSRDNCNGIIETATNKLILGCKNTVIPSTVTYIGDYAFNGCTGLTSITIPSSVTSIGLYAFSGCTGLTSVTIPANVTSIGGSAFKGCTGLTSVTIPANVTSIGGSVFYNCSSLTAITCEATTPPTLGNVGFYNTNNCPILVPAQSVDAYKAANKWSNYADRIQAIGLYVSLSSENIVTGETYTLSVKYNGVDVLSNATVTSTGDVTISGSSFTANSDGSFSITATYNGYTATLNGTASTPQYAVVALDCSELEDANPFEYYDNGAQSNAESLVIYFGPDTYVENGIITIPPEDDFNSIAVNVPDPAYDGCIGYIKLTHPSAEYKLNEETTSSVGEGAGYTCDVSFDSTTLTTTLSNFVSEDQESPFTGDLLLTNCGSTDIKITRIEVSFIPAAEEPAE